MSKSSLRFRQNSMISDRIQSKINGILKTFWNLSWKSFVSEPPMGIAAKSIWLNCFPRFSKTCANPVSPVKKKWNSSVRKTQPAQSGLFRSQRDLELQWWTGTACIIHSPNFSLSFQSSSVTLLISKSRNPRFSFRGTNIFGGLLGWRSNHFSRVILSK